MNYTKFLLTNLKNIFPEAKNIENELLLKRYDHFDNKRLMKIYQAIEKRKELLNNGDFKVQEFPNFNKTDYSKSFKSTGKELAKRDLKESTAVKQEMIKLGKLKEKQIEELEGMIEYELQQEEIREKNEKKMKEKRENDEKIKEEKIRKAKENELFNKYKQEERELKLKEEQELLDRKLKERELKEKILIQQEQDKKEKERNEKMIKQKIKEKKEEEFRKMIDDIFIQQQDSLNKKQKKLDERDDIRKHQIEIKQRDLKIKNQIKSQNKNMKIEMTINKLEERLLKQRIEFEFKQEKLDENRRKFETNKEFKKRINKELSQRKQMEIDNVIKKNNDFLNMKVFEYNHKQEELNKRKKEKEIDVQKSNILKQYQRDMREKRLIQTREKSDNQEEEYKNKLLNKLNNVNDKIDKKKMSLEKFYKTKFEDLLIKREDNYEKVKRYEKNIGISKSNIIAKDTK